MKNIILFFTLFTFFTFSAFASSPEDSDLNFVNSDNIEISFIDVDFSVPDECCDDITVTSTSEASSIENCCKHTVSIANTGSCNFYVIDKYGNSQGPFSSKYSFIFNTCTTQTKTYYVSTSTDPADACWSKTFSCDDVVVEEDKCCDGVSATSSIAGTNNGCCLHSINITNDAGCDLIAYDQNGSIHSQFSDLTKQLGYSTCGSDVATIYFGTSMDPADVCTSVDLTCDDIVDPCCADIVVQVDNKGTNANGCCVNQISISNSSDCSIYLFNNLGNSTPLLPPNSNISFTHQLCFGFETLYVGTSLDPNEACWSQTLTCGGKKSNISDYIETRSENYVFEEVAKLQIAPNPFQDQFKFSFTSKVNESYTIRLFDVEGNIVKTNFGKVQIGQNNIMVDGLSDLPANMYFLSLETSQSTIYERIVKQ